MSAVGWLAHFITHWADRHERLCNFPAYAMLAIPFLAIAPGRLHRAGATVLLAILVAGLEICSTVDSDPLLGQVGCFLGLVRPPYQLSRG